MKHTNLCPKCSTSDIVRIDGSVSTYGTGNNAILGNTVFSAVKVHRCICCSCGYTEEWIDTDALDRIKFSKKAKR